MVMVEGRYSIDTNPRSSKPRGDYGKEADSIKGRIHVECDHPCREFARDAISTRLVERDNECCAFFLDKIEERCKAEGNLHAIWEAAESELASAEDWLRVGEQNC